MLPTPLLVWTLLGVASLSDAAYYSSFTGDQISEAKYRQYQLQNLVPYCAIEVKECNETEPRRYDYTCNNLHRPQRGATLTPYRRMLPPAFSPDYRPRPSSSGAPLPSARAVRVALVSDGRKASTVYTNLVPIGTVFITGDITSVHDTANYVAVTTTCCALGGERDPRCAPIRVADDDVYLRRTNVRCLNLTRPISYQDLGCAPQSLPPERVNTSPPMLELSVIYGNDEIKMRGGREGRGGRLKSDTINGREWPPTGSSTCLQNQVSRGETRCHNTPVAASNAIAGANILVVWIYRLHNTVAKELEGLNPCWDDERLFRETREVVIAYMNYIWYYEMFAQVLGHEYLLNNKVIYNTLGHVDDYNPKLEPRVTIEYVVGTRWFHTMQEGRLKMYNKKGKLLDELKSVDLTLRTGILPINGTMEGLTQGMFRQPCAEADHLIDPEMGERVLGSLQFVSDVMSSDLMKGREAGLPPYNQYRGACRLPVARRWKDLRQWMPDEQVDALRLNYESVEDVDIIAGILAEKPMKDAAVGPTLACIMADQLRWWRQSDRFWYENRAHPGAFTAEQLYEIKRVTMARVICDYGDDVDSVQPWPFLVPGPGNEIRDCKQIPRKPSLEPWRDNSCTVEGKPNPSTNKWSEWGQWMDLGFWQPYV